MKGPRGRSRYTVERVWLCPLCQRQERTAGDVVARRCTCSGSDPMRPNWMRLLEDAPAAAKTEPGLATTASP
jgi:hypothetical protein